MEVDAVFLRNGAHHFAGVAHGNDTGGDVFHHHAPGPDDRIGTDGDSGRMVTSPPSQTLSPSVMGLAQLQPAVALLRQDGMDGRVHAAAGADEAVLSNGDLGAVHQVGPVVEITACANDAVVAVVRVEMRQDHHIFRHAGQQLVQQLGPLFFWEGGSG